MKVLLIQPPVRDFYQTAIRTHPIGLAYLAAALRNHHHEAEILDCQPAGRKKTIPLPGSFSFIKPFYPEGDISPFRLHAKFFHFGHTYEEIRGLITESMPDAVGISCQFTPYVGETIAAAAAVKSIDSKIPVILGGTHASTCPEQLLRNPAVDYVIIGEGEETLPLLIATIETGRQPKNLQAVGFKDGGACCVNPRKQFIDNLDVLAFPARDLLETSAYTINGMPYTMLITSRGCPQNCTYCSVASIMGKTFRPRSPDNIIREIAFCRERFGITIFDIEDDNFTLDPDRAVQILEAIIDRFGENKIKLTAMNGLSVISLNEDMLRHMKRAGFQHLDLALGSSSAELNRRMNRQADAEKTESVLSQAHALGFPTTTYIILGIPGHRPADMMDSIVYLAARHTLLGPSIFYPSPGTRLYETMDRQKTASLADNSLLRSSLFPVETDAFSRIDLISLLRLCRWINFIKRLLPRLPAQELSFSELLGKARAQWWPDTVCPNRSCAPGDLFYISFPGPLHPDDAGKHLTALFLHWKIFYGIRRISTHNKDLYTYQFFPYKTSSRVIDLLWQQSAGLIVRAGRVKRRPRE